MAGRRVERNALEWGVFALGTLLTLGVAGFLAADALRGGREPDLRVAVEAPRRGAGGLLVPVRVTNAGAAAGLDVQVEVCAPDGTCDDLAFPFVPRGASREGVAAFASGPGPFTARVASYQPP